MVEQRQICQLNNGVIAKVSTDQALSIINLLGSHTTPLGLDCGSVVNQISSSSNSRIHRSWLYPPNGPSIPSQLHIQDRTRETPLTENPASQSSLVIFAPQPPWRGCEQSYVEPYMHSPFGRRKEDRVCYIQEQLIRRWNIDMSVSVLVSRRGQRLL